MKHLLLKLFGLTGSSPPAASRQLRRTRLFMEALEDRSLPSTTTASFVVTIAGDPLGAHQGTSLRDAIKAVNADKNDSASTPDTIQFNIAGPGVQVIDLNKALPAINRPVVIDGTTQSGY